MLRLVIMWSIQWMICIFSSQSSRVSTSIDNLLKRVYITTPNRQSNGWNSDFLQTNRFRRMRIRWSTPAMGADIRSYRHRLFIKKNNKWRLLWVVTGPLEPMINCSSVNILDYTYEVPMAKIVELKLDRLPHPQNSPDLTPCDSAQF